MRKTLHINSVSLVCGACVDRDQPRPAASMARMAERDSSEYDVHKVVLFGSGDAGKSQLTLRFMYSEVSYYKVMITN